MSDGDSTSTTILLQLAQETRDDVKHLLQGMAALEARVSTLEAAQGPQANMKRDAVMVGTAASLAPIVVWVLQSLGLVRTPVPPVPMPTPPAIAAPAPAAPAPATYHEIGGSP